MYNDYALPSTFQSLVNGIFKPYLRKFILVIFYDILIYNNSLKAHLSHVSTVMDLLRSNTLYAKRSKCYFRVQQMDYLRHYISGEKVSTDPKKVEAMV